MPNLPRELLDHIVNLLHDDRTSLGNCCLVSKSWIARTRAHLSAEVAFRTTKSLESWKRTFPDPSASPAHYTKSLFIGDPGVVTALGVETGSWIRGFSRVVHLAMAGRDWRSVGWNVVFIQFRGFSPFVKSLMPLFYSHIFSASSSLSLFSRISRSSIVTTSPITPVISMRCRPSSSSRTYPCLPDPSSFFCG